MRGRFPPPAEPLDTGDFHAALLAELDADVSHHDAERLAADHRRLRFAVSRDAPNQWFDGDTTDTAFASLEPTRMRITVLAATETAGARRPAYRNNHDLPLVLPSGLTCLIYLRITLVTRSRPAAMEE